MKHLHTTVGHGHGVIRRGITGDLTVIGTGGRCKNVARVDKVRAGGVSTSMGPAEEPGIELQHVNVSTCVTMSQCTFFFKCHIQKDKHNRFETANVFFTGRSVIKVIVVPNWDLK